MSTLNVRIEEKTKERARKVLSEIGLDLSTGVKLFLNQVVTEQGLPFRPTKNPSIIRSEWDKEVTEALKNNKRYKNGKEVLTDIL